MTQNKIVHGWLSIQHWPNSNLVHFSTSFIRYPLRVLNMFNTHTISKSNLLHFTNITQTTKGFRIHYMHFPLQLGLPCIFINSWHQPFIQILIGTTEEKHSNHYLNNTIQKKSQSNSSWAHHLALVPDSPQHFYFHSNIATSLLNP
jgi:hypothetical protein